MKFTRPFNVDIRKITLTRPQVSDKWRNNFDKNREHATIL